DPELRSVLVDHADFTNTNAFVGANAIITSGRTIEGDISSYLRCLLFRDRGRRECLRRDFFLRAGDERVDGARAEVAPGAASHRHGALGPFPTPRPQPLGT